MSDKMFLQASIDLHLYIIDPEFKGITSSRSISLTTLYDQVPEIDYAIFMTGMDELLLIERDGFCRRVSLETDLFL
jgi:hypothetical protein